VGKSNLVALVTKGQLLPSYLPTIGAEFDSKIVTVPGRRTHLLLQLWVS
jgi:GTPase SAR1 family protein